MADNVPGVKEIRQSRIWMKQSVALYTVLGDVLRFSGRNAINKSSSAVTGRATIRKTISHGESSPKTPHLMNITQIHNKIIRIGIIQLNQ